METLVHSRVMKISRITVWRWLQNHVIVKNYELVHLKWWDLFMYIITQKII
jgi:hypothetical protein